MELFFNLGSQAILANENGSAVFPMPTEDSPDANQEERIVVLQNMN